MSRSPHSWIGTSLSLLVMALIIQFALNSLVVINGVGLVDQLGEPWNSFWLWAAAAAVIGAVVHLVWKQRQRQHERALRELAQAISFTFVPSVESAEVPESGELPVLRKWSSACNRLTGQLEGVPVQMLDYTYVEKGDEGSSYYTQTVVIVPTLTEDYPQFELRPWNLAMQMLGILNIERITFSPEAAPSPEDRECVRRFNDNYFLSEGLDVLMVRMRRQMGDKAPKPSQEVVIPPDDNEEKLRRLFSLDRLYFLADHPGWYAQSSGRHLALWRRNSVISAEKRPEFLAEALALRQNLVASTPRSVPVMLAVKKSPAEPSTIVGRLAGTVIGVMIGFLVGGGLGMAVSTLIDPFKGLDWLLMVILFFSCPVLGMIAGGILGNRLLGRFGKLYFEKHRGRTTASLEPEQHFPHEPEG